MSDDLDIYPSLEDPMFNIKIANKKEFNDTSFNGTVYKNISERSDILSNMPFEISSHQLFVKSFLSFLTPYNSLLLYHGLGTGKTCSAIGAAEDMRQYLKQFNINKSIIIVASPNVQENFKLQLFDENRLVETNGEWEFKGCVGNAIINEINPTAIKNYPRDKVIRQIKTIISKNYTFLGYIQFANLIENLSKDINKLKNEFNGRLVIVDEYHNMRTTIEMNDAKNAIDGKMKGKKQKQTAYQLDMLVENAENLRLLLLSATPMYNSYKEIIWTLNLLNKNDKRPLIKERDIFEVDGNFKEGGVEKLISASRGYISFVKGDNPYIFPFRVYPQNPVEKLPKIQLNGISISEKDKLHVLKSQITMLDIKDKQNSVYQYILDYTVKKDDNFETMSGFKYTDLQLPIQSLNIAYPFPNEDDDIEIETGDSDNPRFPLTSLVGTDGLKRIMSYNDTSSKKNEFVYKSGYDKFFSIKNIGDYSCKIKNICDKIISSVGVVLVYSSYLDGGLIPLALALEELGIQRIDKTRNLFKTPPVAYSGMSYAMITGDTRISPNNSEEVNICTKLDNMNGDLVKVIMITNAGAEGIDLKYIRQVHIMDPWYNMNRIEQIIGRAVRNFSHKDLPFEFRNVELFLYTTRLPPNEDNVELESLDLYMYRKAETKAIQMGRITRVLKENAVDCLLNYEQNNYTHANMKANGVGYVRQILSDGTLIKKFPVGDKPYSVNCDYMKQCEYVCVPYNNKNEYKFDVNDRTYDEHYIKMNTGSLQKKIVEIFKNGYFYNYENLYRILLRGKSYSELQIYYALNSIIEKKIELMDKHGRPGYLVNVGEYYLFQPKELQNLNLSVYDRVHPIDYKRNKLNIKLNDKFIKPLEEANEDELKQPVVDDFLMKKLVKCYKYVESYYENPNQVINKEDENHFYRYSGQSLYLLSKVFPDYKDLYQLAMECIIDMLSYMEKVSLLYCYINNQIPPLISDYVDNYFKKTFIPIEDNNIYVLYRWNTLDKKFELSPKLLTSTNEVQDTLSYDVEIALQEALNVHKDNIKKMENRIIGFVSYDVKKNDYYYKMIDLNNKRNTGRFCYQKTKKDVIKDINEIIPVDILEELSKEPLYNKFSKEQYCVLLMLTTKILNYERPDKTWYLPFEQYQTVYS
jgi:Helicase conserved C-terminal domain/Type III restriction enzyme, res subunit